MPYNTARGGENDINGISGNYILRGHDIDDVFGNCVYSKHKILFFRTKGSKRSADSKRERTFLRSTCDRMGAYDIQFPHDPGCGLYFHMGRFPKSLHVSAILLKVRDHLFGL